MVPSSWKSLPIGLLTAASLLLPNTFVFSKPTGFSLQKGDAKLIQVPEGLLIQAGKSALIHWEDFSIAREEILRIMHAGEGGCVVNRVLGATRSEILGQLLSNGSVYLINPNGVLIGKDAYIDTAGFIASTLDFLNEDLLEKTLRFQGNSEASVVNEGKIHCRIGDVYLIGRTVENSGEITTENGKQGLLSGFDVLVRPNDAPKVQMRSEQIIDAKTFAENPYALAIRHSGKSKTGETQAVYLKAAQGLTEVFGEVTSPGGTVHVLGDVVRVDDEALIDVSHDAGGGTILVGGDYQGKNEEVLNALVTYFGKEATLKGDALKNGDGGRVILWADEALRAYGKVSVRGGEFGGDGGLVETSSHGLISIAGLFADRRAPFGQFGTLLLDPCNVTISNTATTNEGFAANTYTPTGTSPANILNTELQTNLAAGNVTVLTTGACGGGELGSITIANDVTWSANTTLTLTADSNIVVNAGVTVQSSYAGATPVAAMVFTANGTSSTSSGIVMNGTSSLIASAGSISLTGTGGSGSSSGINIFGNKATIQTGDGNIVFQGTGGTGGSARGVIISGATPTQTLQIVSTGAGNITFQNCTGGDGGSFNQGVYIGGYAVIQANTGIVTFATCTAGNNSGVCQGIRIAGDFVNGTSSITSNNSVIFTNIQSGTGGTDASGMGIGLDMTISAPTITLTGIQANTPASGNSAGFSISQGILSASTSLSITATSVSTVAASTNFGIQISPIATTSLTTTTGTLSFNGSYTGNASGTSVGTAIGGGTISSSSGGNVVFQGTSNGQGGSSHGLSVTGALASITSGTLTFQNCSSGVGSASHAVSLTAAVTTASNTVFATCNAGAGAGNIGVLTGALTVGNNLSFSNCTGGTGSSSKGVSVSDTTTVGGNATFATCTAIGGVVDFMDGVIIGGSTTITGNLVATINIQGEGSGSCYGWQNAHNLSASNITITGTGVSSSGGANGTGIEITGTSKTMQASSTNGSVTLVGIGSAGWVSMGVRIDTSAKVQSIDGPISITGSTTGATNTLHGIQFNSTVSPVTSTHGSITISGIAGASTIDAYGVSIESTWATGTDGTLTFQNCSGGTGTSYGVSIAGTLTTLGNAVFATCTAGSGASSYGVRVARPFTVTGSCTFATITTPNATTGGGAVLIGSVTTIGGNLIATTNITTGTGNGNAGWTQSANTTVTGTINIAASSGSTAGTAPGITLTSGTMSAAGSGAITLSGTSGPSSGTANGINLASGSAISAVNGNVLLTGTARGTADFTQGIAANSATIQTTGSGNITFTGVGSSTNNGGLKDGVWLATTTVQATGTGGITFLNCAGGTTSGDKTSGVVIVGSSTISSTSGTITFDTCTGGTNAGVTNRISAGVNIGSDAIVGTVTVTAGSAIEFKNITGPGGTPVASVGIFLEGQSGVTNLLSASRIIATNNISSQPTTSGNSYGFFMNNTTLLASDSVQIEATATNGTFTARGIYITANLTGSTINATNTVTLTGHGTTTIGGTGVGLKSDNTSITGSTITISGTSGGQGANSHGVALGGFQGQYTGNLLLATCTGGSGATSHGISIEAGTGLGYSVNVTGGNLTATTNIVGGTGSGSVGYYQGDTVGGGNVLVDSGRIIITATTQATAGNADGVHFENGTLRASTGSITVTGTGGVSSASSHGINFDGGTVSTTSSGPISLFGSASGTTSIGINLSSTNSVTSSTGSITLSGTSTTSHGVSANTNPWTTGTSGTLTFQNCQCGANASSFGVILSATVNTSTGSAVFASITTPNTTTSGGAVLVSGPLTVGGNLIATTNITTGTGANNIGWTQTANTIASGAGSQIQISASSLAASGTGYGISLTGGTMQTSSASGGSITLLGTGTIRGLRIAGATITTTANSGTVTLTGTGDGASADRGLSMGNSGYVVSGSGPIIMVGNVVNSGVGSAGLRLEGNTTNPITSTSGSITISGSTNSGAGFCHGFDLASTVGTWSTGATTRTITFSNCLSGVGGSDVGANFAANFTTLGNASLTLCTARGNSGNAVTIANGSSWTVAGTLAATNSISTSGSSGNNGWRQEGTVTVTGTVDVTASSLSSAGNAHGIYINKRLSAAGTSTITLQGTGGASASASHGIFLESVGNITSASGPILLSGTASGAGPNQGIQLTGGASPITSTSGPITLTGTTSAAGNGVNVGTSVTWATGSSGLLSFLNCQGGSAGNGVNIGAAVTTNGSASFSVCTAGTGSGNYGVSIAAAFSATNNVTFATITTPAATSSGGGVVVQAALTVGGNLLATTNITTGAGSTNVGWAQTANTTVAGTIDITASSGSTLGAGHGIFLAGGVMSTTAGGAITLNGTSGISTGACNGVNITGGTNTITTSTGNGAISISGLGRGTTAAHVGVNIASSQAGVITSGSGSISITGTSTAAVAASHGVLVANPWAAATTGLVTFTGSATQATPSAFPIVLAATFSTGGVLTYNNAVGIGTAVTSTTTITSNGAMTFASTIDGIGVGINALTLSSQAGSVFLNGDVGSIQRLSSFTIASGGAGLSVSTGMTNIIAGSFAVLGTVPTLLNNTGTLTINTSATTGGGISFGGTIDGASSGANSLTLTANATGTVTLSGNVGNTTPLGVLTVPSGLVTAFDTLVATVNVAALNIVSPVPTTFAIAGTVTVTASAAGGIIFGGDLNGTANGVTTLNLTATAGSVTFGADVGDVFRFAAVNIIQASSLIFTPGTHTVNVNSFSTAATVPVSLQGTTSFPSLTTINTNFTSGPISFGTTINGDGVGLTHALTLNAQSAGSTGTVTFNGNIGNTNTIGTLTVTTGQQVDFGTGVTTVTADSFSIAASIPTLLNNTGTLTINTSGFATGSIAFGGSITGASAGAQPLTLTANATGTVTLSGNVGATRLGNLTISSGAQSFSTGTQTLSIAANSFTVGGTVPTTLNNTGLLTINTSAFAGGSIAFGGSITGASAGAQALTLTANATGGVTLSGNVGATRLGAIIISSGAQSFSTGTGITSIAADSFTVGGTVPTTLNNTGTLTINTSVFATGSIAFGGIITGASSGAQPLTLSANATGTVTLSGNVGATPLGALTISSGADALTIGSGVTSIAANSLSVGGTVPTTFATASTLTVTTTTSDGISFGGLLNAPATGNLTLVAGTGPISFSGNVGGNDRLGALTVSSANGVTLGTSTSSVRATSIAIGDSTSNSIPLTLGFVGTTAIDTTGASGQIFGGSILALGAGRALTLTATAATGPISFGNGSSATTIGTSGTPLGALLISTGTTATFQSAVSNVYTAAFTSSLPAIFAGTGATTITTSSSNGNIVFSSTVNGLTTAAAHDLTLTAGTGAVQFANDIGTTIELGTLSVTSAASVAFQAGSDTVTVKSLTIASGIDTTLAAATTTFASSSTPGISFGGPLDGTALNTQALTATASGGGSVTFSDDVGSSTPLAAVSIGSGTTSTIFGPGTHTMDVNSLTIASGVAAIFQGTGLTTINTNYGGGGVISFGGTVDGQTTPGGHGFVLTAGAGGAISFAQDIGSSIRLGDISANTALSVSFAAAVSAVNANSLTIGSAVPTIFVGTGTTTITTTPTSSTGNVSFGGTINGLTTAGGHNVTITAGTGNVTFGGNIGATLRLGALSVTSATLTSFTSGVSPFTVAANSVSISSPAQIAETLTTITTTPTSGTGNISFGSTLDGSALGKSLTLVAGSGGGSITFTGAVGSTNRLNALTVTSVADLTASSTIAAVTLTQTAGSGTSTFNGAVNTTSTTSLTGTQFAINNTISASSITFVNSGLLAIAAAGDMTTTSLDFHQSGGGAIQTAGNISSARDIFFTNAITLTGAVTMTAVRDIEYTSTINGGQVFTVSAGDDVTYNAAVGGSTPLTSIQTTATAGIISIFANQTVASGPMIYNGDVVLEEAIIFTDSGAGAVQFITNTASNGDAISGPEDCTIVANDAAVEITGNINLAGTAVTPSGGRLTVTAGSGFTIEGDIFTTGDAGGGAGGDIRITSANGSVTVDNIDSSGIGGSAGGDIYLAPSPSYSGGYPVGLLILNGDTITALPISASGGAITFDATRTTRSTVATIVSSDYPPGNSITVQGRSITMGTYSAMTIYGDIELEALTLQLSDIVALEDLTLVADTVIQNTHGDETILTYLGDFMVSPSLHFLSGGTYSGPAATSTLNAGSLEMSAAEFQPLLIYEGHILNYDDDANPLPPPAPIPTDIIENLVYEVGVANSQLSDHSPTYARDFPPSYYLRKQMPYVNQHSRNLSDFEDSKMLKSFPDTNGFWPVYSECWIVEDSKEEMWLKEEELNEVCLQP